MRLRLSKYYIKDIRALTIKGNAQSLGRTLNPSHENAFTLNIASQQHKMFQQSRSMLNSCVKIVPFYSKFFRK